MVLNVVSDIQAEVGPLAVRATRDGSEPSPGGKGPQAASLFFLGLCLLLSAPPSNVQRGKGETHVPLFVL